MAAPVPQHAPIAPGAVLQLALAQALAVLAAAGAATVYARWLQPAELAGWLLALAVARAGALVLEGGLKTTLHRCAVLPHAASLQRTVRQGLLLGVAGSGLAAGAALVLAATGRLAAGPAWLLALCPAAYWLSQPLLPVALARLERAGRFGVLGRAEGASLLVEFALPAALLAAGLAPAAAFGLAVLAGRMLRTGWTLAAARALPADADNKPSSPGRSARRPLWHEGTSVQAVAALSMLRDQMHLWLLAPWFGAAWAGLYALAGMACALVGQAPVQTAARVLMPQLRRCSPAAAWPLLLRHTRLLASACLPPLLLLPAWLAWADARLWGGSWAAALPLLPWLLVRMVAGVALTTLGAQLLLAPGAWTAARTHARWTALEIGLAAAALAAFGPLGLAVAGALGGWLGLLLFLRATRPAPEPGHPSAPGRLPALLAALLLRPALVPAALLAAWVHWQPQALAGATLALPLCWLAEPGVRDAWRRRHVRGSGRPLDGATGLPRVAGHSTASGRPPP